MATVIQSGQLFMLLTGLCSVYSQTTPSIVGNITQEILVDRSTRLTCMIAGYNMEFMGDVEWWRETVDDVTGEVRTVQIDDVFEMDHEKYHVAYPPDFTDDPQVFELTIQDLNQNDSGTYECRITDYDDDLEVILIANKTFVLTFEEAIDSRTSTSPAGTSSVDTTYSRNTNNVTTVPTTFIRTSTTEAIDTEISTSPAGIPSVGTTYFRNTNNVTTVPTTFIKTLTTGVTDNMSACTQTSALLVAVAPLFVLWLRLII